MFSYCLLVSTPEDPVQKNREVRPGPDMDLPTIKDLQAQVKKDLGFVPDWLASLTDPNEYVQVEDEHEVFPTSAEVDPDNPRLADYRQRMKQSTWFTLVIEGSENHVMPPLCKQIAWLRAMGDYRL